MKRLAVALILAFFIAGAKCNSLEKKGPISANATERVAASPISHFTYRVKVTLILRAASFVHNIKFDLRQTYDAINGYRYHDFKGNAQQVCIHHVSEYVSTFRVQYVYEQFQRLVYAWFTFEIERFANGQVPAIYLLGHNAGGVYTDNENIVKLCTGQPTDRLEYSVTQWQPMYNQ